MTEEERKHLYEIDDKLTPEQRRQILYVNSGVANFRKPYKTVKVREFKTRVEIIGYSR